GGQGGQGCHRQDAVVPRVKQVLAHPLDGARRRRSLRRRHRRRGPGHDHRSSSQRSTNRKRRLYQFMTRAVTRLKDRYVAMMRPNTGSDWPVWFMMVSAMLNMSGKPMAVERIEFLTRFKYWLVRAGLDPLPGHPAPGAADHHPAAPGAG